ncbi:hypothetical protein [Sporolituus thermophilus]|uniref:Uncharacterized protein n=1 Tax=Sporolituus thermophilus DSM 23256 TaxID=1123285 RepID=A0A1G7PIQ2_9FIRM|nr:hypothetical protein [Sporolituus thermophilus]SDF86176.1 hypothetical protein SAMN05660235_02974 [Sporolituus thermophilus DSM 23256]
MFSTGQKLALLKKFYSCMKPNILKLEVNDFGFDFIDIMRKAGVVVDYVDFKKDIHKYRIRVSPAVYDYLLKHHIAQNGNVCGYFDDYANDLLCFNIDNRGMSQEETYLVAEYVYIYLKLENILPLMVESGRGYHIWVKLGEKQNNEKIYSFSRRIVGFVMDCLKDQNIDTEKVFITLYPTPGYTQGYSLRLFGSKHIRTGEFSRVVLPGIGILDENESWRYFGEYVLKTN